LRVSYSALLKIAAIVIAVAIGLIVYAPPNAEFMPEEKRFPYVTFPLLPPLIAIALSIATRQVLPALFAGVWIGALMVVGYNPVAAFSKVLEWYVENAIDTFNATVLIFDFIMGAFVGLLYASGAVHSLAEAIARKVRSARGASLMASILGVVVFFDDYSNTVIVGTASRPVTDRTRVSRELLSYIVDSTAAPVAGIALVSTWIGYEVSLINQSFDYLSKLAEQGEIAAAPEISAYAQWLQAVPYHFYSILAIILVFLAVLTRRHFGPMLKAEHRAAREGKVLRDGARPLTPTEEILGERPAAERRAPAWLFLLSIVVLVVVALLGLWITGAAEAERWWEKPFSEAIMNGDAAKALLWASFAAYMVALVGSVASKSLSFSKAVDYTVKGMYLMVLPNAILLNAWSIKSAADAVGTADFVVHHAVAAGVPVLLVPLLIFLSSMVISFTTGTSWGTFGLMMPLAVPMAWKLAVLQYPDNIGMAYLATAATIGAVFGGGIFGDHCSPISDTTIMSSMFSSADHIDHVNTQMPYAVLAATVSIVLYSLFAAGVTSPLILLPIGVVLLAVLHYALSTVYAKMVGLPPKVPNYVVERS